jgi:MFS family permease
MKKRRMITRTVWILSMVSMLADVASEMLYPVVPAYLRNIGFTVFLIGLLEGIAEATAGLSKGFFGNWSDQTGKRMPFVRLGYFLSALAKPMMAFLTFPLWIFFARATDRLGKGLRTAPRDALLSAEAAPGTKAAVFSFHRGWDTMGAVIGPMIALLFLSFYPGKLTSLFYLAFIPGILAVLITFLIREKQGIPGIEKSTIGFFSYFRYWKKASPDYRRLLIPFILFALFNSSDMLLLLKVKESTGSDTSTILVYVLYNLVYAMASYPAGLLADRINMKKVFLAGLLLFSVTYFAMAKAESVTTFYFIFGIYGVYMAATEGVTKAWISELVKKEDTGTAIGLFVSLQSVSLMIASTVAGLIWSRFGASPAFLLTAVVSLMVFLIILLFIPKPVQ